MGKKPKNETPAQRERRKAFPKEDLDNITGDSEDSYSDKPQLEWPLTDASGSENEKFITKKISKNDFKNQYASKESLFWIEILQRGRRLAKDFKMNVDYCNRNRLAGLSFVEWFGFLDKYYSECSTFNINPGSSVSMMPIDRRQEFMIDETRDPRFQKPTNRKLRNLFPEFEQALKNSKLDEIMELKKDPRVVAASMKEFINSYKLSNTATANFANRSRMKPTGIQEDYLAKLLSRVSSPEMKQLIEKKLYQEKTPDPLSEEGHVEDLIDTALAEIVKGQEFVSVPTYELPEEYTIPSFIDEVHEALESETENDYHQDVDVESEREPFVDPETRERRKPPKLCRVCSGIRLEPMNGPFLLQLVDDVGMVLPRRQTNLCARHQKKVRRVLMRSVAMGVLDWKAGTIKYLNPFEPEIYPGEIPFPTHVRKGAHRNK